MTYKLEIYKVENGDDWPMVGIVYGETEQECIDAAEKKYGSNEGYHWTNPVVVTGKASSAGRTLRAINSDAQRAAARKNGRKGGRPTLREQAQRRVNASSQLSQYEAVIMYDWPEGDEHWRWVIRTTVAEIVDWAKTVKAE